MKTRKLVLTSLFIALSFIGANINVMGTIAFDSMPGFLGTLILGPTLGAVIGAAGHILTAVLRGFPNGLPVHIIIALGMAITMYVFGVSYKGLQKRNLLLAVIISSILGVLINGPITIFMVIPITGSGILVMLPILSLVSFLNILIAHIVYKFLPGSIKR